MPFVLALDQGTTSSRAIVFDETGKPHRVAQREYQQIFPQPGWVEHDPTEIWSSQMGVATEALAKVGLRPTDIAAIGITNQRETTIVWDRATGRPLHNAIVWQDRRTADYCQQLRATAADSIRSKTGLVVDAYFSGSKLRWLLSEVPDLRRRAEAGEVCFGTVDSWLCYQLTGGNLHITDPSNASRTLLYNIHQRDWDAELLEQFEIPRAMLPEVRPSSAVYGDATVDGLRGIPIAGIAGDQQAALFGQLCHQPGLAKNTYGTGCFTLMQTGPQPVASEHQLLTTIGWQIGEETTYALEGSVFIGGAVVQWLRDGLKLIRTAEEIETLAATVPDNGGVYLVPAFAGLGAPHWDPYARGTIVGLTRGSEAGHIARAALEAIAFQVADLLDAMGSDAGVPLHELRVDGGAARNNLLMQLQADFLQAPLARPHLTETTALGAAYLAGLATGVWSLGQQLQSGWQLDRRFEPSRDPAKVHELRTAWTKAITRARDWSA